MENNQGELKDQEHNISEEVKEDTAESIDEIDTESAQSNKESGEKIGVWLNVQLFGISVKCAFTEN